MSNREAKRSSFTSVDEAKLVAAGDLKFVSRACVRGVGTQACRDASLLRVLGAIGVLVATTGCLSVPQQIVRKTEEREFSAARDLILNNESPDPAFLEARASFTHTVEYEYGAADGFAASGELSAAREKAVAGLSLAPWSAALKEILTELQRRIGTLRQTEIRLAGADVDEAESARQFLLELRPLGRDFRDSPVLTKAAKAARKTLRDLWSDQLAKGGQLDLSVFDADMGDLQLASDPCVAAVRALATQAKSSAESALSTARKCGDATDKPGIPHAARQWVDKWVQQNVPVLVRSAGKGFGPIQAFEDFRTSLETWPEFDCALAALHFAHAETRAGMGLAAVLALLHAERAQELCPNLTRYAAVRATALATLSNEQAIPIRLTVDADPRIDPQKFEILRSFVIKKLRASVRGHIDLTFEPIGTTGGQNLLYFSDIDLYVPGSEQLSTVRSTYFSHNESVPNPRKQALRYQLDREKIDLDYAESAVSSAIRSHNIAPSDWSLQNVNRARRQYTSALNSYNELVDAFNETPSTILEPVYSPYSFAQGKLWSGWSVDFAYTVSSAKGSGVARSVDECFVRIGTQFSDRNVEWRRDIPPTIDLSVGRVVQHLDATVIQVLLKLGPALANSIDLTRAVGLNAAEIVIARWLLHPWGATQQLGITLGAPAWSTSLGVLVRLPERKLTPPRLRLPATKTPPTSSVEKLAEWSNGLVGRIKGKNGYASGALISGDGLVLTCAHCLEGEPTRIGFADAAWAGDYPIEVVFVNSAADLALIRAVGLHTPRWFPVRTDTGARKGEAVVALGNMSLRAHSEVSTNAGITTGVVADPEVSYGGAPTLIADVAVASGSSGGPLISRETGEIVGVVTLVIKGGFSDGRAQAGTVCGATPSSRFGETVGLAH